MAAEFSKDVISKDNGGDLGWLPHGIMNIRYGEEFGEIAFDLELDTMSELIPGKIAAINSRYWLIEVLGREDSRPLGEDQRVELEYQAFDDWFTEQRDKFAIQDYLNPELRDWAIKKALD